MESSFKVIDFGRVGKFTSVICDVCKTHAYYTYKSTGKYLCRYCQTELIDRIAAEVKEPLTHNEYGEIAP